MATTQTPEKTAPGRRIRWLKLLLVVLLLLVAGVLSAPSIIANTPLLNQVLGLILAPINGTAQAEGASLGWFSPVVVYQISIRDAAGDEVLRAEKFHIDQPLWKLILEGNELGQIKLHRPQLSVVAEEERVNVVDVFGPLFAPPPREEEPPQEPQEVIVRGVQIVDAVISIVDHTSQVECKLADVDVEVDTSGGPTEPAEFTFSGELDIQRPGPAGLYQPPFVLSGAGRFDPQLDVLKLTRFAFRPQAGPVSITAEGEITEFSTAGKLDLRGQYTYDLADLAARLRPWVGGNLQLAGAGTRPFRISGPVGNATLLSANQTQANGLEQILSELTGDVALEWDSASAFGLSMGHARLEGKLAKGWAHLAAKEIVISEGNIELATRMSILSPDPVLVVEPGRLIDRVTLTPEVCAEGLMYIAPILAETTRVKGHFSLDLEQCEIPLSEKNKPALKGQLSIHSVDVGAGPLVKEFADLLQVKPELRLVDQSDVKFELVGDRVYHQGLKFQLGQVAIMTDGSVGLDESLDLVASMPVPDAWLGDGAIGERLRGRSIRVPVGGTLSNPKLDVQRIPAVNAELLTGPARPLIEKAFQGEVPAAADFLDFAAELLRQRNGTGETPILDLFRAREEQGTPILDMLRQRREQRRLQREALKPPPPPTPR